MPPQPVIRRKVDTIQAGVNLSRGGSRHSHSALGTQPLVEKTPADMANSRPPPGCWLEADPAQARPLWLQVPQNGERPALGHRLPEATEGICSTQGQGGAGGLGAEWQFGTMVTTGPDTCQLQILTPPFHL